MSSDDPIVVRANRRIFSGWTSLQVSSSLADVASEFSVSVGAFVSLQGPQLRAGDSVEVQIGDDRVFTGYVEDAEDQEDDASVSVKLGGRSLTCDVADCSAPPGVWAGLRYSALVAKLLAGYSVEVVYQVAGLAAVVVPQFRVQAGETLFAALERLAKERSARMTDDPAGRLVFTRAGLGGRASDAITRGQNALSISGKWNVAGRYSVYESRGQSISDAEVRENATGAASDPAVRRFRKLIVKPEKAMDNAGARERARFEATQRAAQSLSLTYRVRGWRQSDGALWAKNTLVQVVDPRRGFFGSDMLISKVTLGLDENGRIADLTVDPVATYEVEKTLIAKGSGGRWFGSIEGKDLTTLTPEQIRATGDKP